MIKETIFFTVSNIAPLLSTVVTGVTTKVERSGAFLPIYQKLQKKCVIFVILKKNDFLKNGKIPFFFVETFFRFCNNPVINGIF